MACTKVLQRIDRLNYDNIFFIIYKTLEEYYLRKRKDPKLKDIN